VAYQGSDLNSATYAISAANAVSADGSIIVGSGLTALGQEAFIWDIAHGMRNLPDVLSAGFYPVSVKFFTKTC